ncbi:MAG: hypothetical protein QM658_02005 [Gordonia sp. (in: high G+C Gram-positive bacteria)]
MTGVDTVYRRLRLADDLVVTWDRHLLTVATSRWEPGTFVYDVEFLAVGGKHTRNGGTKVALGGLGAHFRFHVLRFELDAAQFAEFDALITQVRAYRDERLS